MSSLMKGLLVSLPILVASPAYSNDDENSPVKDAWLDGRLDTVILLNRHLNPFKIDTEVENGKATITGSVDSSVEKSLASELAKGIEGITDVDNKLEIVADNKDKNKPSATQELKGNVSDAAISTAISTKLLLNTDINSLNIDVDTNHKVVKLNGFVESDAERDLVEQIAKNTFDVESVNNRLKVKQEKS